MVLGAKPEGKVVFVRCPMQKCKEKQCDRGVRCKISNSSNIDSCSNKSGMDNVNVFSVVSSIVSQNMLFGVFAGIILEGFSPNSGALGFLPKCSESDPVF